MPDSSIWFALFVVMGVLAGTGGGVLMWLSGVRPPAAIFTGFGCFMTVVYFLIAAADFLTR